MNAIFSYLINPLTYLMNYMKNQISALSDSLPSLDDHKKKHKLVSCGRLLAKIFTFNSSNVINYTIYILLISQDYYLLCYQVYD